MRKYYVSKFLTKNLFQRDEIRVDIKIGISINIFASSIEIQKVRCARISVKFTSAITMTDKTSLYLY